MAFHLNLPKTPLPTILMPSVALVIHVDLGWELWRLFGLEMWFGRVLPGMCETRNTHTHMHVCACVRTQNHLFYKALGFFFLSLHKNPFQRVRKIRGLLWGDSTGPSYRSSTTAVTWACHQPKCLLPSVCSSGREQAWLNREALGQI